MDQVGCDATIADGEALLRYQLPVADAYRPLPPTSTEETVAPAKNRAARRADKRRSKQIAGGATEPLAVSIMSAGRALDRSRAWVWLQIRDNPEFPKPVVIGGKTMLIWSELKDYIAGCAAKRDA